MEHYYIYLTAFNGRTIRFDFEFYSEWAANYKAKELFNYDEVKTAEVIRYGYFPDTPIMQTIVASYTK